MKTFVDFHVDEFKIDENFEKLKIDQITKTKIIFEIEEYFKIRMND